MKYPLLLVLTLVGVVHRVGSFRGKKITDDGENHGDTVTTTGEPNIGLKDIKNQRVVYCIEVRYFGDSAFPTHHGLIVRIEDGSEWLIHKGPNYGKEGTCADTVVVDVRKVNWKGWIEVKTTARNLTNCVTIGELVAAVQGKFNLIFANCIQTVRKMKEILKTCIKNTPRTTTTVPKIRSKKPGTTTTIPRIKSNKQGTKIKKARTTTTIPRIKRKKQETTIKKPGTTTETPGTRYKTSGTTIKTLGTTTKKPKTTIRTSETTTTVG